MVRGSDNSITRQRTSVFGETRTAPVSWPTNHGFLDKPVDATGLVAVGARYYDPGRARFISVDPVMDLSDPRQWNPYAYASNNPITFMDPTGMFWAEIGTWINDNQAAIVGGITAVVVTSGCLVATGGTGSVLCAAAGGAAAGAASNLWATQVQEVAEFSWTSLATDTAIGGATGALTGAIPGVGQAIARSAVGQSVASSSVGTATRAAATTVTRAASRVPGLNRGLIADDVPTVVFSRSRAPGLAQNFDDAVANGAPTQLTRVSGAVRDANRRAALRGRAPAPAGQSLDEYPFACSAQGGCGSFVRSVPRGEQSYQGGVLSRFFLDKAVRDGDPFKVVFGP